MQICEYAQSLSPPVKLDITEECIPAEIIILYFCKCWYRSCKIISWLIYTCMHMILVYISSHTGVLFAGKGKPVLNENREKVLTSDGSIRLGRGFEESTFRKVYHGLKTLHKHFQKESDYKVSLYQLLTFYI